MIQLESLLLTKYRTNALLYPGEIYDPELRFSPLRGQYLERNGKFYAMFSAAFAAISSVLFSFMGYPGLYVVPALSTLALLVSCSIIARRVLPPLWIGLAILLCGLCTPLFFYSLVFWEHTPAALLLILGLCVTLVATNTGRGSLAVGAGLLMGLAVWLRNEALLGSIAAGLALLVYHGRQGWPAAWHLGLGVTAGVLPLLAFNQWVYGAAAGPHVLVAGEANYHGSSTLSEVVAARLAWASFLLVPGKPTYLVVGVMLLLTARLVWGYLPTALGPRLVLPIMLAVIALLGLYALAEAGNRSHESLLLTCPLALLALLPGNPSMSASHDRGTEVVSKLLLPFAVIFVGLGWVVRIPDGGAQWGPRMILPVLPVLILVGLTQATSWIGWRGDCLIRSVVVSTLLLLSLVSLLIQISGLRHLDASSASQHQVVSTVAESGERVVVTDSWYAPLVIAPLFYDGHLIYLVNNAEDFDALLERLAEHKVTSFYYLRSQANDVMAESRGWNTLLARGATVQLPFELAGSSYVMPVVDSH